MAKGIWVTPTQFVSLDELKDTIKTEMVTRQFAQGGYTSFFGLLPDPDPILKKLGCDQKVYDDLVADSRVGSMIIRRKNQTKGKEWDFDLSQGAGDREVELCKMVLRNWEDNDISIKDLISQSLNPIFRGYSVFEIIWDIVGKYWLPVRVEEKPREWFFFDNKNQLCFRDSMNPMGIVIRGKDADPRLAAKFIVLRNDPTYANPYGDKALSRCYWPVTFKRGGWKLFAEFIDRFGAPFIYGKLPRSAKPEDHEFLYNQLINFISGAVGTGPDDSSVQIIETKAGSGSTSLHQTFIDMCNNEISESILTNSLSTSVQKNGARSSSETGADTIEGGLGWEDIDFPTSLFNKIFKRTIDLNIGSGLYPEWRFFKEENINKEKSDRDKNLKDVGVKFKKNYFVNNYNFKEDEFDVTEPVTAGKNIPGLIPDQGNNPQLPKTELSGFQKLIRNIACKFNFSKEAEKENITNQVLDALPEKLLQYGIEQTLKPVIELAKNSAGYEEFKIDLVKQFPKMETSLTEELLTKIFIIAEIEGEIDAKKDA